MKNRISEIYRVEKLLDESFRLAIILKATKNSNPLTSVILGDLENHLKDLDKIIKEKLKRISLNEIVVWHFIGKLVDFLYKFVLNATLHCKFFLLRQKLNINIYYENI